MARGGARFPPPVRAGAPPILPPSPTPGMDPFYLTARALPRLSLLVLTVAALVYFALRARKTPETGWLALALAGFAVHHAAFIGFSTIVHPRATPVLNALTWSSVFVGVWAFVGVALHFQRSAPARGGRLLMGALGAVVVAMAAFMHLGFGSAGLAVSDTALQVGGTATVVGLGLASIAVLARRARRLPADVSPERRAARRRAFRAFFAITAVGLAIPVVGVFRDAGLVSAQLDEQVALVLWAAVMLGLITLYVNHDPQPTSVLVKVVAFAFMAVVTALGVASVVAFPERLPVPGGPPQPLRLAPDGDGLRVEALADGAFRALPGAPISVAEHDRTPVPLGFAFPFAGRAWTEFHVDDDGFVAFGPGAPVSFWELDAGVDAPWIAPLLVPVADDTDRVSVHRDSARATVSWRAVPVGRGPDSVSFQITLAADGSVEMRYGAVPDGFGWVQGLSLGSGGRPERGVLAPGRALAAGDAVAENRSADWFDAEERRAAPYAWLIVGAGLLVLLAFPVYLREGLSRPLGRLVEGVRRAARGHLDGDVAVGARDEIGRLTEDFNQMTHALRTAEASLRRYADELEARVEARTAELAASLDRLRAAQARLVQQEKMASLGALTAGIAHEIKNPLNFVTNFASLTGELAEELAETDDPEEQRELLADVRSNVEKIEAHGRRADAIVRAMMAHARGGSGERRTVALAPLVEEYAALALHGARSRHPGAELALHLDLADAGLVEAAPEEIGRVLVNLLDNAFDAVRAHADGPPPAVRVATAREDGHAVVRVADGGPGMAPEVAARVFEPFFTTKPTGEGTGLGLSLSHDIVAQGHGGTLTVETAPGEGATFTLALPSAEPPAADASASGAGASLGR